jgi:predicted transcriptional regulator
LARIQAKREELREKVAEVKSEAVETFAKIADMPSVQIFKTKADLFKQKTKELQDKIKMIRERMAR